MPGPRKMHGRFFGKWYISGHVINAYRERVDDPQKEKRTKTDIERIITTALRGVDGKSLRFLPRLGDAYVYETYLNLQRNRGVGPYYFLLHESSVHEADKPAVVGLWTEDIYKSHLRELTAS